MTAQTAHERFRAALQALLDAEIEEEGWMLDHYVVVMGIQKIDPNGKVSSSSCMTVPDDQADYITAGLLDAGVDMHAEETGEDD